jgi:hypothetical protein
MNFMGITWVTGTWENMLVVGVSMFVVFHAVRRLPTNKEVMEKDWDKKPNQLVVLFMTFTSVLSQPWREVVVVLKGLQ